MFPGATSRTKRVPSAGDALLDNIKVTQKGFFFCLKETQRHRKGSMDVDVGVKSPSR